MALIELQNVCKEFTQDDLKIQALNDINLSIEENDIYGIIGMSGAGKSTLVRCLNYLEKPTSGTVIVDGEKLGALSEKELRDKRGSIAMIFQHFNLLMQKTVIDNVMFPLKIKGVKKAEAKAKAMEYLKTVGLEDKAKAYPSQLSGGQKQRVAIARALACNPKILLCDEATSALDPQTTESILSLLKEINENTGITIVIITHQMSVVETICNKVAIIDNGNLVETGLVADVFANPKSIAAKKLIFGNSEEEMQSYKHIEDIPEKGKTVRIVFSENSSFEPVVADLILQFNMPVNILYANTKNVGGIAKGDMVITLPEDEHTQVDMIQFLRNKGLEVQEVSK
ncbi:MAG: ATP-binding cassette domain-containing protein [Lachnospiraceae bacterium]|nr:ATP-binding cassette domain-containing protein [Lachnospiraceae bacterium]